MLMSGPSGGSGGGALDFLTSLTQLGTAIVNPIMQMKAAKKQAKAIGAVNPMAMMGLGFNQPPPGQFQIAGAAPGNGLLTADAQAFLDSLTGGGGMMAGVTSGGSSTAGSPVGLFRMPVAGPRAVPLSLISQPSPSTGRTHYWRHVGQPIMFSGDVSHCRRVNKLLAKQARRAGRRGGR